MRAILLSLNIIVPYPHFAVSRARIPGQEFFKQVEMEGEGGGDNGDHHDLQTSLHLTFTSEDI
jgi:hypothetical protein